MSAMTAPNYPLLDIFFLDLLPATDTGRAVRFAEKIKLMGRSAHAEASVGYVRAVDRRALEIFLINCIVATHSRPEGFCMLHVDAHADEHGIELGTETLPWPEFFTMLRPLNIGLRNRLVVNFGACRAAWSILHLDLIEPAPFFAVNGPEVDLSTDYCEAIYAPFYNSLFTVGEFKSPRIAMLRAAADLGVKFTTVSSFTIFWESVESFLDDLAVGNGRRERLEALVTRLSAAGFDGPAMRKQVKAGLWADQTPFLVTAWNRFSMVDRYPELLDDFSYAESTKYSYLAFIGR